jgi:hypothetical protein
MNSRFSCVIIGPIGEEVLKSKKSKVFPVQAMEALRVARG